METFELKIYPNPQNRPKGLTSFETKHHNLKDWESYFFSKNNKLPECEICGKILKYFSGNIKESVHFDHKKTNLLIKGSPCHWLVAHKFTSENVKIWESCNFGILCNKCNFLLVTKNRKNWLEKAIKYTNKE